MRSPLRSASFVLGLALGCAAAAGCHSRGANDAPPSSAAPSGASTGGEAMDGTGDEAAAAAKSVSASPLAGTTWQLASVTQKGANVPVAGEAAPDVTFGADGRLSGFGGCNRFFGTYTLSGETLHVGPVGMTKMACFDHAVGRQEQAFVSAIAGATRVVVEADELVVVSPTTTLRLKPAPDTPAPGTPAP